MTKISKRHLKWLALFLSLILLFAACSQKGGLRPLEPTVVPSELIGGQPQLLTFTELEADPNLYRDKLIRVTGSYISLPVVACAPYSGPNPAWSMVADDLRLDTLGFEGLLFRLAEPETTLTVDGILRRYDGPLGCGKRPSAGILWYLEALQIVQPNPLVLAESDLGGNSGVVPPPFPTGTPPAPAIEETLEPEPTTGPGTPSRTPTPTSTINPTISATPTIEVNESGTPTSTPTPSRTQTPPPGGTAPVGTATPTSTRTPIPASTSSPPATAPPGGGGGGGGYPVVTNTPYP